MRRVFALVAVPLVLLAAACGQGGGSGPAASPSSSGDNAAFDKRAAEVAAVWRASSAAAAWRRGFVPLQELTVLPSDAGLTDATKQAYLAGWFRSTASLSTKVPAGGTVQFGGGGALAVPLVSAADAYRAIDKGDPSCPRRAGEGVPPAVQTGGPESPPGPDTATTSKALACTTLTVTGATLGTVRLLTSRGEATVPAWLFTVDELARPLARVAVAPDATTAVPSVSMSPYPGGRFVPAEDLTKVDDAELGYRLVVGACDKDITPLVSEADDVVVVAGQVTRSGGACIDLAKLEPVTVTLAAPLADRPVLDAVHGKPLRYGS